MLLFLCVANEKMVAMKTQLESKKNILISIPSYYDTLLHLPYIHALLKCYCEKKDPTINEKFNWLEPIFLNDNADILLEGREKNIDVLGLSCYTWNWHLQIEIAKRVKAVNPGCLVVMGGPHPDWNDADFYSKFPFVDVVVKNEGEEIFYQLLMQAAENKNDFSEIPNLILKGTDGKTKHTKSGTRLDVWDQASVWQSDDMKMLAAKYSQVARLAATWETNRGCPYQCSFCDWGSATYSKIRLIPEGRLADDLKFFAEYKIHKVVIADANFGMFPRDIELARKLGVLKSRFGYPKLLYWASAKNKAETVLEIAKIFYEHDMDDSVVVGIQSMNENTILEMGRGTHSLKTFIKLSKMVDDYNIPKIAQIIMGSPKETAQGFIDSLHETVELGFHKSLFTRNFAILPNAPIAKPEQLKKYNVRTIDRPANKVWGHKSTIWKWTLGEERIVVGHDCMTTEDWIYASLYKTHLMCLHHLGLTRMVSRLFHNIYNIRYETFYSFLYERARSDKGHVGSCYNELEEAFKEYLTEATAIHAMTGIDQDWFIDHESALFCRLMLKRAELFRFLENGVSEFANLHKIPEDFAQEALNFQFNLIITPDYDSRRGHSFESQYDFNGYFKTIKDRDDLSLTVEKKPFRYKINEKGRQLKDSYISYDWFVDEKPDLIKYQHSVIIGTYQRYILTPLFEEIESVPID